MTPRTEPTVAANSVSARKSNESNSEIRTRRMRSPWTVRRATRERACRALPGRTALSAPFRASLGGCPDMNSDHVARYIRQERLAAEHGATETGGILTLE